MDLAEKATTGGQQEKKNCNCCYKTFLAVALVMGTIACALSIATLTVQLISWDNYRNKNSLSPSSYTPQQEKQLLHQVAQYLHDSEYSKTNSKRTARQIDCSSTYDSTLTVKPSAHLAGKSYGSKRLIFKQTFFQRKSPILSVGWSCDKGKMNHVLGGMKYNSQNGFLKVPTDGMYYVYSQVLMNVSSPDTKKPIKLGHLTVKCTCNDESQLEDNCRCYSMQDSIPYSDGNDNNIGLMESYSWNKETSGGSTYHGGLFHLTANSYIGIVPVLPSKESPQISIIAESINSFFGAFYVTGLTYPPAPSPSPNI